MRTQFVQLLESLSGEQFVFGNSAINAICEIKYTISSAHKPPTMKKLGANLVVHVMRELFKMLRKPSFGLFSRWFCFRAESKDHNNLKKSPNKYLQSIA
ncbi:hypothetical protein HW932_18560 [Allochromatium humboldtianum]|uniref:Uncharacterized protein n=1 Tax=Allochromatium humboldtianum TaxID=504901 RepID=A0A850RGD3_9GAMM|nr:hypothetical protein [Allochromatium humboldtianum]NVZ11256.1 hypothetical protein [Allochromatium humboldtianum]